MKAKVAKFFPSVMNGQTKLYYSLVPIYKIDVYNEIMMRRFF
jgi:hypothetical protein